MATTVRDPKFDNAQITPAEAACILRAYAAHGSPAPDVSEARALASGGTWTEYNYGRCLWAVKVAREVLGG
jgi:hypothetical protein